MTTYTLTQSEIDMLISHGGNEIRKWLHELKPNSQEPSYYLGELGALTSASRAKFLKLDTSEMQALHTHPAPMSKEDMVKVLGALEMERIVCTDHGAEEIREVTPKHILEAITIMQSAIEGME
jgi:hypothetical protein